MLDFSMVDEAGEDVKNVKNYEENEIEQSSMKAGGSACIHS